MPLLETMDWCLWLSGWVLLGDVMLVSPCEAFSTFIYEALFVIEFFSSKEDTQTSGK